MEEIKAEQDDLVSKCYPEHTIVPAPEEKQRRSGKRPKRHRTGPDVVKDVAHDKFKQLTSNNKKLKAELKAAESENAVLRKRLRQFEIASKESTKKRKTG